LVAVQNCDFKNFTPKVAGAIKDVEAALLDTKAFNKGRELLAAKYERASDLRHLEAFVKRVEMAF
jgi:hypothetical protein